MKSPAAQPLRLIRLALPQDQHSRLRVRAAQAGLPMSQFVARLVERELSAPSRGKS